MQDRRTVSRNPDYLISLPWPCDSVARTEAEAARGISRGIPRVVENSSRRLASSEKSIAHPDPALVDRSAVLQAAWCWSGIPNKLQANTVSDTHGSQAGCRSGSACSDGWHPSLNGGDEGSAISPRAGEGSIAALRQPEHLKERVSQRGFPYAGDAHGRAFSAVLATSRRGVSIPVPVARLEPGRIPHGSLSPLSVTYFSSV